MQNAHTSVPQRLLEKINSDQVVDAVPLRRQGLLKKKILIFLMFSVLCSGGFWWIYKNVYLPRSYYASVQEGYNFIKNADYMKERSLLNWDNLSKGKQSILIGIEFSENVEGVKNAKRIKIGQDALNLAIFEGEPESYYQAGEAMEKGWLGPADEKTATAYYEDGVKKLRNRSRKGDVEASMQYALLQSKGLGGLKQDPQAAKELLKNVYKELSSESLHKLANQAAYGYGIFAAQDFDFALKAIDSSPSTQLPFLLAPLATVCYKDAEEFDMSEYIGKSFKNLQDSFKLNREKYRSAGQCVLKRLEPIEGRGDERVLKAIEFARAAQFEKHAVRHTLPLQHDPLFTLPSTEVIVQREPAEQEKTGHLTGAPKLAKNGLSTFSVNNTQGSADAIARIYLNGAKQAVRSLYVKQGENFTTKNLARGTYTLRYRFSGSLDTYEALTPFVLEESQKDNVKTFSKITVTLYPVENGNLQTKKVPPENF